MSLYKGNICVALVKERKGSKASDCMPRRPGLRDSALAMVFLSGM